MQSDTLYMVGISRQVIAIITRTRHDISRNVATDNRQLIIAREQIIRNFPLKTPTS